ncbi:MAG: ABC transporter substrate-binding protein, partial [Clostridiales bacterium]|nr:ABC transporter substrate-binding protein [Clostridiales bacterium]
MKQWTKPAALVCLLTLISCSSADKGEAYIIAAPVPLAFAQQNTCFLDGVKLAEEDIQSMDLPVSLQVQVDDDNADFSTAIALAQKYISNPSIIGVVGHWYSDICLPISELYKKGEKTLIVPTVSISALTNPPSDYLFRNIPDDSQIARKMCDYAVNGGVKTAVIYYEDSTYGFRMSAGLELYANSAGIDIADRVCNPSMTRDLPDLLHK